MIMELKRTKSKNNCCVPQCNATYKNSNVSLHKFPMDKLLLKKWVVALKMGKKISPYMKVCSLHFKDEDFFFKAHINQLPRLKRNVVPSQNLPIRRHDKVVNHECVRFRKERINRRQNNMHNSVRPESEPELTMPVEQTSTSHEILEAASNLLLFNENNVVFNKTFEDKAVQVNTYEEFADYNVVDLIDTDYKCKILTGIVNLTVFGILVNAVSNISSSNTRLCSKNKVLLTLMKLKLDMSFISLGVLFKVSSKAARSYFYNTLEQLSVILKPLIRFPSKEEILGNMPFCFDKYRSTRLVLDCTEIAIEKSKCLKCRINSYSYYKKKHTIKYLIGVSPSGLITFLSKGYGGRASDKAIFNAERVIEKLDPGDAIMVDKGILIENECRQNFVKLIYPPFLRKNMKQFSKDDATKTASIARARVHVERAIQRIKIFRICKGTVLWALLPHMDNIMIVIAGLTNLGPPILAYDKFHSS